MDIEKLIKKFLKFVIVRNAIATYKYYKVHIYHVYNYLKDKNILYLNEIPQTFSNDFIEYQKLRGCKNITINKRLEAFRYMLKFHELESMVQFDKPLKEQQTRFDIITQGDLKKIMNHIYFLDDSKDSTTIKLVIMLLIETGCRINELLNIEINNIDLETNTILLTKTKTNLDRYVYFRDYTKSLLIKYLKFRSYHKFLLNQFRFNTPLTYKSVVCIMANIKRICDIKKLSPHMFRHTCATLLIEHDAPITAVQRLLGHTNIKTTERYLHESQMKIKSDYTRYFPDLLTA